MREKIVAFLMKHKQGAGSRRMAREMGLSMQEQRNLRKNLKKMEEQGVIRRRKDRYFVPAGSDVVKGEFISSSRGFGFVRLEPGGGEDVFIPSRHTGGAASRDTVAIIFRKDGKKGKPEGRVVGILKKGRQNLLGVYVERLGRPFLLPLDSPLSEEIPLASPGVCLPRPGAIVEMDRDTRRLTLVLGMPDEPGVDTEVVIRKHGLFREFSEEAADEARSLPGRISSADQEGRRDYRNWRTVTIDGESAQDFDDAVSIRRLPNGNFLLGVHIADVSHYVLPDSAIDREALARGTSAYFPDLTLPMLPEKLSNDLCSLRPRRTRLTFSVILEVEGTGSVLRGEFHPSLIKTAERLTYTSVFKLFQGDEEVKKKLSPLVPDLLMMKKLASLMRKRREEQGSLNFDLLEPELDYREGKLRAVGAREQNEAHQLIEEFMVAANEVVASYLAESEIPSLYRVHPPPSAEDLERLRLELLPLGIVLAKPEKVRPFDLQHVLKTAEGRREEKFINSRVLRALKLAVYSPENIGHYGLAKKEYTHFTSPIRRYPDLIVHRLMKSALLGERPEEKSLGPPALHLSDRERRAEAAERELIEWRIFRFLKERLGEEFEGVVVDISRAGLVVELTDYFVEGVVAFSDLGGDYFRRTGEAVIGRRTRRRYAIGDKLKILLASVDPILRRMSLVPVEPAEETAP